MKLLKVLGHPILLVSIFPLLLIEGDNFGGLYLLYILLALPHGALYAVLAVLGPAALLIGYGVQTAKLKFTLNLMGLSLMIFSLVIFFAPGNKSQTFHLAITLSTFIVFGLVSLCFIVNTFIALCHPYQKEADFDTLL